MVKIGTELPKLFQNKTGYQFFGPPCMLMFLLHSNLKSSLGIQFYW